MKCPQKRVKSNRTSQDQLTVSAVFAGQSIGVTEVSEKICLVTFIMQYDLGFFDHETGRVECAKNPFDAKVLCPEWTCCAFWRARRDSNSRPLVRRLGHN